MLLIHKKFKINNQKPRNHLPHFKYQVVIIIKRWNNSILSSSIAKMDGIMKLIMFVN